MKEIYIFGSVCRGEPDLGSDVDVLVIDTPHTARREFPANWSCYSRRRLRVLFGRGTLFAWHLYLEAVQVWPRRDYGYLQKIGPPRPYRGAVREVTDLQRILLGAVTELTRGSRSSVYEFGLIALACRDIAMAAAPALTGRFDFSRYAPVQLAGAGFPLTSGQFEYLLACRRATTRGGGLRRRPRIERRIITNFPHLQSWCAHLLLRLKNDQLPPQD